MRIVKIASSQKPRPIDIETNATTWGALQRQIRDQFGDVSNMRATVKETKNDLPYADSLLPAENFTLFLTAKAIKAGATEQDVVSVLESLRDKFNEAIDNLLEEIEAGDHEQVTSTKEWSAEDQEFFRKLSA